MGMLETGKLFWSYILSTQSPIFLLYFFFTFAHYSPTFLHHSFSLLSTGLAVAGGVIVGEMIADEFMGEPSTT